MSSNRDVLKSQFLTLLFKLPIVSSIVDFLTQAYECTKASNGLIYKTFSVAKDTASFVVNNSWPIISMFKKPAKVVGVGKVLNVADNLAVKALEVAEEKLPIITRTPDQVQQETQDMINAVASRVSVIVSLVTSRVTLTRMVIVDRFGRFCQFAAHLFHDISPSNEQMKSWALKFLQLIGFYSFIGFLNFYFTDIKTRREVVRGIKISVDGKPPTSEDSMTSQSLVEEYAFGLHFLYARTANTVLALEYQLSSRIESAFNTVFKKTPIPEVLDEKESHEEQPRGD